MNAKKVNLNELKRATITEAGSIRYGLSAGMVVLYDTEEVAENIYSLTGQRLGGCCSLVGDDKGLQKVS